MQVYKFGGASVKSAKGIKRIVEIVSGVEGNLFIVVSAMGKTTNAMEVVHDFFMKADKENSLLKLAEVEKYHLDIINQLFENSKQGAKIIAPVFEELRSLIKKGIGTDFDMWYDRLVSYGEIISTLIVSAYLKESGIDNQWLNFREILLTDSNFREANVNMVESKNMFTKFVDFSQNRIYVGQGFIGANRQGEPTTLGREGSDYSAAVVGNLLNAESVTIWKDVLGILNADPREFSETILIPELSYQDAVELAFSGAQVMHPKTIKPLHNSNIPLFVKPFSNPSESGTIIHSFQAHRINVPVFILKKNMVLVTLRPIDFSFVLEESLSKIFMAVEKHHLKVSLIQSSAVSISICISQARHLQSLLNELSNDFDVSYNDELELLTIRGTTPEIISKSTENKEVLLQQRTRQTARFVMRNKKE